MFCSRLSCSVLLICRHPLVPRVHGLSLYDPGELARQFVGGCTSLAPGVCCATLLQSCWPYSLPYVWPSRGQFYHLKKRTTQVLKYWRHYNFSDSGSCQSSILLFKPTPRLVCRVFSRSAASTRLPLALHMWCGYYKKERANTLQTDKLVFDSLVAAPRFVWELRCVCANGRTD